MTRAQARWVEAASVDDGERVIVTAGRGAYRRARRALEATRSCFAQIVSRRGRLVAVVNRWPEDMSEQDQRFAAYMSNFLATPSPERDEFLRRERAEFEQQDAEREEAASRPS